MLTRSAAARQRDQQLEEACQQDNWGTAVDLLAAGARLRGPASQDLLSRLMLEACRADNATAVAALVAGGAGVNQRCGGGWLPLDVAAHWGKVGVTRRLLALGAQPDESLMWVACGLGRRWFRHWLLPAQTCTPC